MSQTEIRPYRLRAPCPKCPFRSDIDKYLTPERVEEIADSLYGGADFPCHQTTVEVEDDETGFGDRVATLDSAFCAGALITMEKEGFSNQQVRIGERLGLYDPEALKMDAPVYGSLSDWVASYRTIPTVIVTNPDGTTETLEMEHCGVVGPDCEDPPGYSMGGGVAHSTSEPVCHPIEDCCGHCGNTACPSCKAAEDDEYGNPVCVYCAEDQE